MHCTNINECFDQINAYFDGEKTGHFLIVNTQSYDIYQEILQRLEADNRKKCIFTSENCLPNGLPDVDAAICKATGKGHFALIGLSQAQMLRGDEALEVKLDEVLSFSISGYSLILLDHCEQALQKFIRRDIRVKNRVILVDGNISPLPQIKLAKTAEECIGCYPLPDFPSLLAYLENLTDIEREHHPTITICSQFPVDMFRRSIYSITASDGIYDVLIKKYTDLAGATEKSYGTDAQWIWLSTKMEKYNSFSALICDVFGATTNLSVHISDIWESTDKNRQWLLWLSLKTFGESNNHYLTYVLGNSDTIDSFAEHAYLDFADIDIADAEFDRYYYERKRLLERLPEDLPLIEKYCDKLGRRQKDEIFYLTDSSTQEKYNFVRCLSIYDFTPEELNNHRLKAGGFVSN